MAWSPGVIRGKLRVKQAAAGGVFATEAFRPELPLLSIPSLGGGPPSKLAVELALTRTNSSEVLAFAAVSMRYDVTRNAFVLVDKTDIDSLLKALSDAHPAVFDPAAGSVQKTVDLRLYGAAKLGDSVTFPIDGFIEVTFDIERTDFPKPAAQGAVAPPAAAPLAIDVGEEQPAKAAEQPRIRILVR
jgi:hypothetical protein